MPFPAHFLPREKCSHHSFPLKGGGSCVGPGPDPDPGGNFLIGANPMLVRAPGSEKAPFLAFPHSQGFSTTELPALALANSQLL